MRQRHERNFATHGELADRRALKVGILGGSFDPLHVGHLELGRAAKKQLNLSKVYLLLSPRSPLKNASGTALRSRIEMVQLGAKSAPWLVPALWELKRKGPSYTVKTLRDYKQKHPSHRVFLIMGSDSFAAFGRWKDPLEIVQLSNLVVGRRRGGSRPKREWPAIILKGSFPFVSSTDIRNRLKQGQTVKGLVPPSIYRFIKRKKLYR